MSAALVQQMAARLTLQGRAHGVEAARGAAFDALCVLATDAPHLVAEAADVFQDVIVDIQGFHQLRSLDQVLDDTNRRLEAGL